MSSQSATATNWSRYAGQAAKDLEENRRRQHKLTQQLNLLQREESLLLGILNLADHPAGSSFEPSHVPEQAQDDPDDSDQNPATVPSAEALSSAADSSPTAAPARPGAARAAGADGRRKTDRQPPLWEVLLELLRGRDEPCLATELREELLRAHPDREPTYQVVRNTLETVVAKGHAQRHKQNRSVLYSAVEPDVGATDETP
ncbi:hypothetical protein [Streptomyces sp. NPDC057694]|uniref:hypothetical protein n=1 Tax=Streptomyces sp. NPDC057694 TaxID=3346216 RepID=UPI00368E1A45